MFVQESRPRLKGNECKTKALTDIEYPMRSPQVRTAHVHPDSDVSEGQRYPNHYPNQFYNRPKSIGNVPQVLYQHKVKQQLTTDKDAVSSKLYYIGLGSNEASLK